MPKLQQLKNGSFTLCLPRSLVRAKGWSKGTEISLILNSRGNIEILSAE